MRGWGPSFPASHVSLATQRCPFSLTELGSSRLGRGPSQYPLSHHSFPHSFIPRSQHSLPAFTVTLTPRLGCGFHLQRRKLRHRTRE